MNLANLYRVLGREVDAERVLEQGLDRAPRSGILYHTIGLTMVRVKRTGDIDIQTALTSLQQSRGR